MINAAATGACWIYHKQQYHGAFDHDTFSATRATYGRTQCSDAAGVFAGCRVHAASAKSASFLKVLIVTFADNHLLCSNDSGIDSPIMPIWLAEQFGLPVFNCVPQGQVPMQYFMVLSVSCADKSLRCSSDRALTVPLCSSVMQGHLGSLCIKCQCRMKFTHPEYAFMTDRASSLRKFSPRDTMRKVSRPRPRP